MKKLLLIGIAATMVLPPLAAHARGVGVIVVPA